ncbi:MAG: penicillin acylase family protein [Polyangiaceae bacterium]|nr:penicillin acylase family protein [Polyangiaceae bacterium]
MTIRRRLAVAACASLSLLALPGCGDDENLSCTAGGGVGCPTDDVFPGLTAEVRIRRDDLGLVHVYGAADADVFYGSGYAQAVDRLFQMDLTRRRAAGRQAEVLGPGAAGEDELLRTIHITGWSRQAQALLRQERPDIYALLVAWTAGVNARIEEVRSGAAPLPYGFGPAELDYMPEPWTPLDAIAVGKLILFGNANQIQFEVLATILRDYFPELNATPLYAPLDPAFVLPPEERPAAGSGKAVHGGAPIGPARPLPPDAAERLLDYVRKMAPVSPGGSNNWAIDGRHTDNGRPIIANDPHQGLRSPSLMWAHHMNSADAGGSVDVAGFAFVGTPGVELGHNRSVAWAATTNYPDVMDLWGVVVDGGVAHLGGEQVPVSIRSEQIVVKGEGTRTIEAVDVPGYGVLLPDGLSPLPIVPAGQKLLLGWTGFAPTREVEAFFGMASADGLDSFEAAVDKMEIGNFNFVSATADGISYRSSATVPDRGAPGEGFMPFAALDGADESTLWTGATLPPDKLPHSRGGERGWIVSANNDPFGFTSDGSVAGDPYYFGVFFDPGTRAARVESEIERLISEGPVTMEALQGVQHDTYSRLADRLVPELEQVFATVDTDPALAAFVGRADLAQLVTAISGWDRRMVRSSSAALAYHAFMNFLVKRAVGDDFGVTFDPISGSSPIYMLKFGLQAVIGAYAGSDAFLQEGKSLLIMQALDDTAAFLTERYGGVDAAYSWADLHETHFGSVWGEGLEGGSVPTDGADGTVNVSATTFFDGASPAEKLSSGAGAIFRLVTGFDEDGVPRAMVNYPRGNSGDPESPYWDSTLDDWVNGVHKPMLFRTAEVEAGSTEERVLKP